MEKFKEQIKKDLISAMKENNDKIKVTTIRSISSAITLAEKNGSDKAINPIDILSTMSKQRKQSIEAYENSGNTTLADLERKELSIIESYMPKIMSNEELAVALTETIDSMNITLTQKEMGKVITEFKTKYPGQDMGVVSKMIKEKLV